MDNIINSVISVLNFLIECIGKLLNGLINLLPSSPFEILSNSPLGNYLGYINYYLPLNEVISILELWLIAVGGYYLYQIILRWTKTIK